MELAEKAVRRFRERFGTAPDGVAFAPGRVNVIGEHVDYCGLPVLPFALPHGIAIAFRRRRDSLVRFANESRESPELRLPGEAEGWGRYVGAAAQAVGGARGADGMAVSDLPMASGLSSSSALVVASALALLRANGLRPPKPELALRLAAAEQGVAIAGGAMDQSVSLGARAGCAMWIHGDEWRRIPIPPGFRFLAAYSGEEADKGGPVGTLFDLRVREAKDALAGPPGSLRPPLDRRLRHVRSEAARTRAAVRALETGDARALGRILVAGHRSLRDDYEVSSPALDELVARALEAGALGARLTGAGFGGSVVVLNEPATHERVRERLVRSFYEPRGLPPEGALLDAVPSDGARVIPVQSLLGSASAT